jgi:hypothetical protein
LQEGTAGRPVGHGDLDRTGDPARLDGAADGVVDRRNTVDPPPRARARGCTGGVCRRHWGLSSRLQVPSLQEPTMLRRVVETGITPEAPLASGDRRSLVPPPPRRQIRPQELPLAALQNR